ncbi:MAG: hypothetical protein KDB40_24600, partial [Acidimicrobiales bacterium]|nr:hypothetical protein [Acidimicrobiales bacterium]
PAAAPAAAPAALPAVDAPAAAPAAVPAAGPVAAPATPIDTPSAAPAIPTARPEAPAIGPIARPELIPNVFTLVPHVSGWRMFVAIAAMSGIGSAVILRLARRHQATMDAVHLDTLLGLIDAPGPRQEPGGGLIAGSRRPSG